MKKYDPQSEMGERIVQRMEERGLNAKQLSLLAGLNETYVRDLIKAKEPNPRLRHLKALAMELGVTVTWLDSGEESAEVLRLWDFKLTDSDKQRVENFARKLSDGKDSA